MKIINSLSCLVLLAASTVSYSTEILFDNLGTGFGFGGADALPSGYIANAFSTGSHCQNGCFLGDVTLELQSDVLSGQGSINGFILKLLSDNNGTRGSAITTFNNPLDHGVNPFLSLITFTPQSSILLATSSTYWIELSSVIPGTTENSILWSYAASGLGQYEIADEFGSIYLSGTAGPYKMKVEANPVSNIVMPVPLPSTLLMLGTALFCLVSSRNRNIQT